MVAALLAVQGLPVSSLPEILTTHVTILIAVFLVTFKARGSGKHYRCFY